MGFDIPEIGRNRSISNNPPSLKLRRTRGISNVEVGEPGLIRFNNIIEEMGFSLSTC